MAQWSRAAFPEGWADVLVRAVKVLITAFLVFVLKEWIETGQTDLPAGGSDALWVGGGSFVLNAILLVVGPRKAG